MKVLHVTPSFYPAVHSGGANFSLYGLCNALVKQDVEVRVLTTDAAGDGKRVSIKDFPTQMEPGYEVYFCRKIASVSVAPSLLWHLMRLIRWADVVHLTAVYSFPTLPTLLLCRILDKPVVWGPKGSLQRWQGTTRRHLKAIWEWGCRFVMPRKLSLYVTSEKEAEDSKRIFPRLSAAMIPYGVEFPAELRPRSEHELLRMLYLGRFHPIKGIENLLRALKNLNERLGRPWILKLAGYGNPDYTNVLGTRIAELGLSRGIEIIGEVFGEAKARLFEESDLLILPSHTESFGLVVAEALAHGLPVIASKGSPWGRLEEIGCGLWVENDPENLRVAIQRISKMPLREMGERGRQWMQSEFSWSKRAQEILDLYQRLVHQ